MQQYDINDPDVIKLQQPRSGIAELILALSLILYLLFLYSLLSTKQTICNIF